MTNEEGVEQAKDGGASAPGRRSNEEAEGEARPFRTYRGVRFTRSQIYLIFDVSAIQKLTISSVRVWSLVDARKNRLKSPFLCYYRKNIYVPLIFIAKI